MITKAQAITASEFHSEPCLRTYGPRGGIKTQQHVWRRNGVTQVWKTRPEDFKIPVKHGLYQHGYVHQDNAHMLHTAEDCPLGG